MEDWTKVVLYGTYDGFVRSTDESLQIAIMLDGGERVEIPSECVMSADQIVKKDKIKLKDVINRIKHFDLITQAVWINGILNELGSGYGLHKYHEGYKQGKLEGAMEREKVVVPQYVAKYIREARECSWDFQDLFKYIDDEDSEELQKWFYHECNQETLATAWINGYEIEEEKRYTVKVKTFLGQYLGRYYINDEILTPQFTRTQYTGKEGYPTFTRSELEQAGFGWVFDCPGIEIEEVE